MNTIALYAHSRSSPYYNHQCTALYAARPNHHMHRTLPRPTLLPLYAHSTISINNFGYYY